MGTNWLKSLSARALAQIEVLNQQISALRRQLAALEDALDASYLRALGLSEAQCAALRRVV